MLLLPLLVLSCKAKHTLPEGSPKVIKQRELLQKMGAVENDFESLRIKAMGNLEAEGTDQGFRLEIRILKDSVIWVEVGDPILGLKLARGLITTDSLFFINRLDKEFFKGELSALQEKFGIHYGFTELQNALSGNLVFTPDKNFELYYVPGSYVLSTEDPSKLNSDSLSEKISLEASMAYIDPLTFKPGMQVQYDPLSNEVYKLVFNSFLKTEHGSFPQLIELYYGEMDENRLRLAAKKIEVDPEGMKVPFNIPTSYVEMR